MLPLSSGSIMPEDISNPEDQSLNDQGYGNGKD
jgi:hypothetical protein